MPHLARVCQKHEFDATFRQITRFCVNTLTIFQGFFCQTANVSHNSSKFCSTQFLETLLKWATLGRPFQKEGPGNCCEVFPKSRGLRPVFCSELYMMLRCVCAWCVLYITCTKNLIKYIIKYLYKEVPAFRETATAVPGATIVALGSWVWKWASDATRSHLRRPDIKNFPLRARPAPPNLSRRNFRHSLRPLLSV